MCNNYEVVDKIPMGFFVWNIGTNMEFDDYIPLCQKAYPYAGKDDTRAYFINPDTLKAIRLPQNEVKALRDAACVGVVDRESAIRYFKKKNPSAYDRRHVSANVLDIFNRIST